MTQHDGLLAEMQDEIDQLNATVHYLKLRLEVAVLDEREACARVVEKIDMRDPFLKSQCVVAIRARK